MDSIPPAGLARYVRIASPTSLPLRLLRRLAVTALVVVCVATSPAAAQSTGSSFCNTQMAQTIQNMFTVIQFGGPLIGGLIALGATVAIPMVRRADRKQEFKELRNQGLVYGVLVAPLGTAIITFLLNNVVAGGTSCGF
jgi:hypothetical protein